MTTPAPDNRSSERRARDEVIAAEPPLPFPDPATTPTVWAMETFFPKRRPVAVAGTVENGVVRLDSGVTLPERSRVIVVASEPA